MGLVGLFAIFHGHAHGAEMPADASGLVYGLGFTAATALLHIFGIGVGFAIGSAGNRYGQVVVRTAGAMIAVAGLGIVAGVI
jgi:urease accessory protein